MVWEMFFGVPDPEFRPVAFAPNITDFPTGRRLRCFVRLAPQIPAGMTAVEYLDRAEKLRGLADVYGSLYLRTNDGPPMLTEPDPNRRQSNPALNPGLMDLGYEILEDMQEATEAHFEGKPYAGVDEGIEPVPDEHVELVIWAMQRELNRELRYSRTAKGPDGYSMRLPAVELKIYSWPILRALVERRRLRYQQFGIGRHEWETGRWSLWQVPLDPEYRSRREARGLPERNDAMRPE